MRSIAWAMGVGVSAVCAVFTASAMAAPDSPVAPARLTTTALLDPQPDAFPPMVEFETTSPATSLVSASSFGVRPPATLRGTSISNDTPMAPLPPAIVAGPIAFAAAAWIARRVKLRGGRI